MRFTWIAAVGLFLAAAVAHADYCADFSKGEVHANFAVRTVGCDNNPAYGGSLRLLQPNRSRIDGQFLLRGKPARAVLVLTHLSSYSKDLELGGQSPVTISVNGEIVARNLDPGSHEYVRVALDVTKYLRPGHNTIRIQFENGSTHYWIKSMHLRTEG